MSVSTRLFVGNLPENIDENELQQAFSKYGEIQNFELKCKSTDEAGAKKFAFITLSASNYDVESCIRKYTSEDFNGNRLYVTRARESFLERLQRERNQENSKKTEKKPIHENVHKINPVLKLGDKLNPRKRKIDTTVKDTFKPEEKTLKVRQNQKFPNNNVYVENVKVEASEPISEECRKKRDSDKKRLESMQKKRQEFKSKQMIIKTGLIGIDKVQNKKVKFSDDDESTPNYVGDTQKQTTLFSDDDDSGDEVNFNIKKQYEGTKGQKVLDLQSRYKSDKRFVLDERFIEDEPRDHENEEPEPIDVGRVDEKERQHNILQEFLGVQLKPKANSNFNENKKSKPKLGMLRFDPSQPEHSKFLAPVEETTTENKKSKKKKKEKQNEQVESSKAETAVPKIEVSKEQFYKVSDTLKEAIAQPNSFSLRSLFKNVDEDIKEPQVQDTGYILLQTPTATKVKNPFDSGTKNPFVYDSSDSEHDEEEKTRVPIEDTAENLVMKETKAVWKENLFFAHNDNRFIDGLAYFNRTDDGEVRKERRELKSLMKKRIYNTERKNKMFQKKIGGRKKTMKKSYKKKS